MPPNKRPLKSVKMILPALTEATSPYWRLIKYSLFPPLGLATLTAYLDAHADVSLQDEHVEKVDLDNEPDLVIIQVYITNAYRAYEIADHYRARGSYVVLGGLHVTSLPEEAAQHADTIFRLRVEVTVSTVFTASRIAGISETVKTVIQDYLTVIPRLKPGENEK
jgi:radical SAM superfamily enzyme YgiQ (UPF0313 family)